MGRSLYKGIGDAKVYDDSKKIGPGEYLLQIEAVKDHESDNEDNTDYFIVEFKVLDVHHSDAQREQAARDREEDAKYPAEVFEPGESGAWLCKLGMKTSMSNVKRFFLGVDPGLADEGLTEEYVEAVVGEENPYEGQLVRASAIRILTRAEKKPFTKVMWKPYKKGEPKTWDGAGRVEEG